MFNLIKYFRSLMKSKKQKAKENGTTTQPPETDNRPDLGEDSPEQDPGKEEGPEEEIPTAPPPSEAKGTTIKHNGGRTTRIVGR